MEAANIVVSQKGTHVPVDPGGVERIEVDKATLPATRAKPAIAGKK
jgi:hypothetical protein